MSGSGQSLSATNLAAYHHFNCNLYLHNVYHKSENVTGIGQVQSKELSKARLRRGVDWEAQLMSWLDEENMLLTVPAFPMTGEDLMENLLLDDREHVFVAGISFWPPQERLNDLYRDCGENPVAFGLAKPDLLEITRVGNSVSWRVVDAKASASVKTSHHVQIYFYTLCLQYLLPKPFFKASTTAAVWLPPKEGFNSTPPSLQDLTAVKLSLLSPPLDGFLFRRLSQILNLPRESVSWHFNPNCNGCPYTSSCSRRSVEGGELGSMSNISFGQAKVLRNLLSMWRNGEEYRKTGEDVTDIEDLTSLFEDGKAIQSISNSNPITMRKAKRVLALPTRVREGSHPLKSAVVEAARTNSVQLIPRRNYICPRSEEVAIILSLIPDPASPTIRIISFCISVFTTLSSIQVPEHVYGDGENLIPSLARTIRSIISSALTPPSAQFYVFSASENSALQTYLVNAALDSNESSDDIRVCIGTLAQGASLLQTTFQPLVLSGVLLDFLANKQKRKSELQACLERMDLSTDGTVEVLRQRIQDHLRKHQNQGVGEERRKEFGQLSRVVVLKTEIERCLALPVPGFWDLAECAVALVGPRTQMKCPTDEELYAAYKRRAPLEPLLQDRNMSIFTVLCSFRKRLLGSGTDILINIAKPLSVKFMDLCREEKLRKLFYMQQFEVLSRLSELWKSRVEGCPDAPILEYRSTRQGGKGLEHVFRLKSGILDMPNIDKDRSFFDYILTEDREFGEFGELPIEALFDDLGVSGLMFPLNKYTKSRWELQHPVVKDRLLIADIRDMSLDGQHTQVILQTWSSDILTMKFVAGHLYRLSPRLVDFNTSKILTTLFELDLRSEAGEQVPFLKLVLDPNSFRREIDSESYKFVEDSRKAGTKLQSMFRELEGLGLEGAGPLVLKTSQHRAAQHVLSNRLSVIWGPPGTGKTHTVALSLLRLLNVQHNLGERRRNIVFITAMTHAAIEAILNKLSYLTKCYRSIDSLPTEWLDGIKVEHVLKGNDHPWKAESSGSVVYAGTVYQLYNLCKKQALQADVLLIDEAGQLALSAASLVLRSLHSTGKVIIAGDQEQLSPILAAKYPLLKTGPLFSSILDCLVHFSRRIRKAQEQAFSGQEGGTTESLDVDDTFFSQGSVVQLSENFRLNPDLGEFISTIYSRPFVPQKVQARQLAAALNKVARDMGRNFGLNDLIVENVQFFFLALSNAMVRQPQNFLSRPVVSDPRSKTAHKTGGTDQFDMDPAFNPISFTLLRLELDGQPQEVSYEVHIKAEAMLVAALVLQLQRCSPTEDIFVATPHRVQRQAVRSALESAKRLDRLDETFERLSLQPKQVQEFAGKVTVDTVERLQGSEAPFVICLFSLPSSEVADLKFLLERRRLNVAISRAKTLCILISSSQVLRPPVEILADNESAKGYAFLKAYEERAWSSTIKVDIDRM
ncbi:hypothetical protein E1B28_010194 [Marasmius oreades]|uniref:AAA+ ATPase domain-containing protein n=1 Tax=Marasmius oreades TaxID=181124 RepID=A0A9P7RWT6_9AGAR|nr:uncharacterized protein E1B28_010194 [Marasmius oreades]KAG7091140.1 hypothetical protein E1B28_010194 [Marasmius oreades]